MSDGNQDKRVDLPVDLPRGIEAGVFANAFRVIPDTGDTFFLDFLAYSQGPSSSSSKVVVKPKPEDTH